MSIMPGEILEYRVANIIFHQGYFTRRRISFSSLFYPDLLEITDIDVLGIKYDTNFNKYTAVWECKTGQDDKPVESILWLAGMAKYLGANNGTLVRPRISDKIKAFARDIGLSAWDEQILTSQEKLISSTVMGSNDREKYFNRNLKNYKTIKQSASLRKVFWFQKSGFWFETPDARIKKIITALQYCLEDIKDLENERTCVAKDLLLEGTILTSLAILDFASSLYMWQQNQLKKRVSLSLSSGLGSPQEQKKIIEVSLAYAAALKGVNLPKAEDVSLQIPPPPYTDLVVDILDRFYEHPSIAIQVPRFLELLIYEYILPSNDIDKTVIQAFFPIDITLLVKMSKNVVTFLEKVIGFPKSIVNPLFKL